MSSNEGPGGRRGLSFRAVEIIGVSVVVALLSGAATVLVIRDRARGYVIYENPTVQDLGRRYGPEKFSRDAEEWIIRDYFNDRRGGVFLDVGANHYRNESNTYYLETQLAWSGVAVDAIAEFAAEYEVHRPRTRFVAMFASDTTDATVRFFVPDNTLVASANQAFIKRHGGVGVQREVPTTTLDALLAQARIDRIDFMSMDIELAEPKALAGFDIRRFKPQLVCIEGHEEVLQQILDYFAKAGYTIVGKYLRADPHNLYFQPLQ